MPVQHKKKQTNKQTNKQNKTKHPTHVRPHAFDVMTLRSPQYPTPCPPCSILRLGVDSDGTPTHTHTHAHTRTRIQLPLCSTHADPHTPAHSHPPRSHEPPSPMNIIQNRRRTTPAPSETLLLISPTFKLTSERNTHTRCTQPVPFTPPLLPASSGSKENTKPCTCDESPTGSKTEKPPSLPTHPPTKASLYGTHTQNNTCVLSVGLLCSICVLVVLSHLHTEAKIDVYD